MGDGKKSLEINKLKKITQDTLFVVACSKGILQPFGDKFDMPSLFWKLKY